MPRPTSFTLCLMMGGISLLSACGSDIDSSHLDPHASHLTIDFNEGGSGWKSGFADYPAGEEAFYELSAGIAPLSSGLNSNRRGYYLNGNNHSDDLYMFTTKRVEGLEPNQRYDFRFQLRIGTNAQKNCVGVGGAPGEGVWIKVGASRIEPEAINDGTGQLLMNIDKGNQSVGGSDAIVLGDFANNRECGHTDTGYQLKTLQNEPGSFVATTAADGSIWLLLSTDSGFEATTRIYFLTLDVIAKKL